MKNQRLLGIQFARGIAALLVALYHGSRMVAEPQYAGHKGFGGFWEFGYSGVDFFFVLSGFIIYFVHYGDLGHHERIPRYCWRRVTRIYPNYWLTLAAVVLLLFVKHDPALNTHYFLKSMFLLPDKTEPMLGVAWTLVHEMMFYVVFALGVLSLRLGIFAGLIWVAFIACHSEPLHDPFFRVAGSILNLQFLMGITAAKLVLEKRIQFALGVACLGFAAYLMTGLAENANLIGWASKTSHLVFGACAAIVIMGIAAAERQDELRVGKIAEFFGGTSYLLYLVHTIVIGFTFKALEFAGVIHRIPGTISVMVATACAVVVAGLLYRYFDLPVQGTLNRWGHSLFPRVPGLENIPSATGKS